MLKVGQIPSAKIGGGGRGGGGASTMFNTVNNVLNPLHYVVSIYFVISSAPCKEEAKS